MVTILTPDEVARMRRAGRATAATLEVVARSLRPGVSTAEVDRWVRDDTRRRGGVPAQSGYQSHGAPPFPGACCTSRNDVVCHGIPSPAVVLEDGDILNVDCTTRLDGYHGDTSRTFFVGRPSAEARHLVAVAERCLWAGIREARVGARLGDIGAAVQEQAEGEGCSVVRDFGGHGIGRAMHGPPHVAHHGRRGRGRRLRPGMAITIEPMINLGRPEVRLLDDGWTVVTADGSLSAQFEHTVIITETGPEVTTRAPGVESVRLK